MSLAAKRLNDTAPHGSRMAAWDLGKTALFQISFITTSFLLLPIVTADNTCYVLTLVVNFALCVPCSTLFVFVNFASRLARGYYWRRGRTTSWPFAAGLPFCVTIQSFFVSGIKCVLAETRSVLPNAVDAYKRHSVTFTDIARKTKNTIKRNLV